MISWRYFLFSCVSIKNKIEIMSYYLNKQTMGLSGNSFNVNTLITERGIQCTVPAAVGKDQPFYFSNVGQKVDNCKRLFRVDPDTVPRYAESV